MDCDFKYKVLILSKTFRRDQSPRAKESKESLWEKSLEEENPKILNMCFIIYKQIAYDLYIYNLLLYTE